MWAGPRRADLNEKAKNYENGRGITFVLGGRLGVRDIRMGAEKSLSSTREKEIELPVPQNIYRNGLRSKKRYMMKSETYSGKMEGRGVFAGLASSNLHFGKQVRWVLEAGERENQMAGTALWFHAGNKGKGANHIQFDAEY